MICDLGFAFCGLWFVYCGLWFVYCGLGVGASYEYEKLPECGIFEYNLGNRFDVWGLGFGV